MTAVATKEPELGPGTPTTRSTSHDLGPLVRYGLTRVLQMLLTLAALIPLTFLLFRAVPGDPASVVVGPDVDPAVADQLREQYGLDEPLHVQFLAYVKALAHGDLGTSFQFKAPVTDLLAERLLNTAVLVVPALIIAIVIGVLLGAHSARASRRFDSGVRTTAFIVKSAPIFWVSTLALLLFAYTLKWVPSIGMTSAGGDTGLGRFLTLDFLHHLLVPLLILVLYYTVEPLLTMRESMKQVLGQEFMELGRAQGLSRRRITYRHGARNATLPVITLAPSLIDNIIGGQVIIETVFSWPGMGRAIVEAVNNFDYPMMQGVFLLTAVTVILINGVVDILYAYLDPRVRLG